MADESQTFEHPADGSKYASAYIAGVGGGAAVMLIVVLAFATVGVSGPMVVAAGGAVWLAVGLALFALLRPSPIEVRREGEVVWIDGEELSVGTGEVRVEQSSSPSEYRDYACEVSWESEARQHDLVETTDPWFARRFAESLARIGEFDCVWVSEGEVVERRSYGELDRALVDRFVLTGDYDAKSGSLDGVTVSGTDVTGEPVETVASKVVERNRRQIEQHDGGEIQKAQPGHLKVQWSGDSGWFALGVAVLISFGALMGLIYTGTIAPPGTFGLFNLITLGAVVGVGMVLQGLFAGHELRVTPEQFVATDYLFGIPVTTELSTAAIESVWTRDAESDTRRIKFATDERAIDGWRQSRQMEAHWPAMLLAIGGGEVRSEGAEPETAEEESASPAPEEAASDDEPAGDGEDTGEPSETDAELERSGDQVDAEPADVEGIELADTDEEDGPAADSTDEGEESEVTGIGDDEGVELSDVGADIDLSEAGGDTDLSDVGPDIDLSRDDGGEPDDEESADTVEEGDGDADEERSTS